MHHVKLFIFPQNFQRGSVETDGAQASEVSVEPAVFEDGTWRCIAVELVRPLGIFDVQHLHVMEHFAADAVDAENPQTDGVEHGQRLVTRVGGEPGFDLIRCGGLFECGG